MLESCALQWTVTEGHHCLFVLLFVALNCFKTDMRLNYIKNNNQWLPLYMCPVAYVRVEKKIYKYIFSLLY